VAAACSSQHARHDDALAEETRPIIGYSRGARRFLRAAATGSNKYSCLSLFEHARMRAAEASIAGSGWNFFAHLSKDGAIVIGNKAPIRYRDLLNSISGIDT
jgi:hypothetical protein